MIEGHELDQKGQAPTPPAWHPFSFATQLGKAFLE